MDDLIDWKKVKADYDKGLTDQELADKYDIKKNTVTVKRNRSKWGKANRHKRYSNKTVTENKDGIVTKNYDDKSDKVTNKNGSNLNDDQVQYCIYRSKGYRKSEAYRMVYDPHFNQKVSAISASATRLEKQSRILLEIASLRKSRQKHFQWTKDDLLIQMTDMFFKSKMNVELFGVKKSNTDSVYNAYDRIKDLIGFSKMDEVKLEIAKAKLKQLSGADDQQMAQLQNLIEKVTTESKKESTDSDKNE